MGVDALGKYLLTEDEISSATQGLIDYVCPTLPFEDLIQFCTEGIPKFWPSATEALFSYEGTASRICIGTGSCKYDLRQEVTCTQCEDWMGRVSALMETDEFAYSVLHDLYGP